MENENTNEKKKQKVTILVGVVTLLIAILGATYAYFQISTNNNNSNTNITGSTPKSGLVTIKGVTDNLHINLKASDMSYDNRTNEYYATDEEGPYVGTEELGTKTIAEVELSGGEETTKYSCTAKLTVTKVTEPEEDKDTMIDVLQPGDLILQFKGNIISEKLDLSELNPSGSKEYDLNFKITGNTTKEIQAYIKLINKNEPQKDLAGKKLNIDISTSELKCSIYVENPKITQLRTKDSQGYLSENLQGGMYRYQAAFEVGDSSEMTNWILFGTTENCEKDEEEKCTNITDSDGNNMTYADYVDKYMYRIIGITEEGQMYLLKETFLKYNSTNSNLLVWNSPENEMFECLGDKCEWANADLFKRLNGTSDGGKPENVGTEYVGNTDIFVDGEYYDYLKSGDNINGTKDNKGSKWYQLIANHNWMYGDTNETKYNGNEMYAIETGKTSTKRYWPDEGTQTTCSSSSLCTEKEYIWSKSTTAKIGLMYMHDVLYAYTGGNPGDETNVKNSWIHFQKDGYNSTWYNEYFITRRGPESAKYATFLANCVSSVGNFQGCAFDSPPNTARPTFYLSQNAKIKSGNGTKTNPYILDVQE